METQYKILTEADPTQHSVTLLLNGKFGEDAIAELDQSITDARVLHDKIYIDLSEVTLVDRKAIQYFSDRAGQGVKLVNCPIYLKRWITQVSDDLDK